ncbi:hypothetical protein GDO78_013081 [Eleutherodactylus coqui]|uniref:Uncharacterized protein n=1 Tax=Eleutherodactylus coqui TaxID=57060 RepID=A0A8J6EXJ2_ELECQ|nr:hypothetical protein GDO78_013081 [Eleutherodactylus coqui]
MKPPPLVCSTLLASTIITKDCYYFQRFCYYTSFSSSITMAALTVSLEFCCSAWGHHAVLYIEGRQSVDRSQYV